MRRRLRPPTSLRPRLGAGDRALALPSACADQRLRLQSLRRRQQLRLQTFVSKTTTMTTTTSSALESTRSGDEASAYWRTAAPVRRRTSRCGRCTRAESTPSQPGLMMRRVLLPPRPRRNGCVALDKLQALMSGRRGVSQTSAKQGRKMRSHGWWICEVRLRGCSARASRRPRLSRPRLSHLP